MQLRGDDVAIESISEQFGDGLLAFELAPGPLFATLPDGVILKLNSALRALLGYAEGELVGRHFNEVGTPTFRTQALERFAGILEKNAPTPEAPYELVDKSGRTIPVRVSSVAVRESGAVRYVIGRVHRA